MPTPVLTLFHLTCPNITAEDEPPEMIARETRDWPVTFNCPLCPHSVAMELWVSELSEKGMAQ